ncbi:phytanoyl-CoA dioxygenase family protein [Pseudonocardia spinosispora]|uniref:phytanoyl-CoA dioxygenase family protein n=1 Tax=Pseudonocardia spinosispora TaxID=103441 RepID=UPI0003FF3BD8|nr:phytanoyl-CoA dioxygenase family protein [Pseudonocardia spinosispora]
MALTTENCRLDELRAIVGQPTTLSEYPHAAEVLDGVLRYSLDGFRAAPLGELTRAFGDGPGIVMISGAFEGGIVDAASARFRELIDEQGPTRGDHFARPGANDRIWNGTEKLAVRAPETFVEYYATDVIAKVATAWLGPGYQVTSQVNVVNPGGKAQVGHRDYHLGFLSPDVIERYPDHVHRLSPVLTLQGAIAHSDMPVETGPTCYLPHSQKYPPGYLATARAEFREYFDAEHVQLPLAKGDAVFFNPAVIHGAGTNRTADVQRMANLLQISSAFGRAMESIDRERMCNALYPALTEWHRHDPGGAANAVAASAEGYPFPTNLDLDPPLDGLAPPSQADLVRRALAEKWPADQLRDELAAHAGRRISS